jgi:hypothetical protein
MHIDETAVRLQDNKGYVWVMTSLDSAFFLYRPNREGAFLYEMLRPFRGVLVSDFYGVYDSLSCLQQKCLVHFVRDIDDDVLTKKSVGRRAKDDSTRIQQCAEAHHRVGGPFWLEAATLA